MKIKKIFVVICIILSLVVGNAAAEPIMITRSNTMDKVIFDGKWSFTTEWKWSSLTTLSFDDGTRIQLRTAHQDNYVYVFVDAITQIQYEKGGDRATICFDKNYNKTALPNNDDYCFVATLGEKNGVVLQGGSPLAITSGFKKIPSPEDFIGISSVSDENDRYTPIPHPSYEFRIPTDLVGRSDVYGFYVGVYDTHSNKIYSWPQDAIVSNPFEIPSPKSWGQMISPDKSLPEFPVPIVALLGALVTVIFITRKAYSFMNP